MKTPREQVPILMRHHVARIAASDGEERFRCIKCRQRDLTAAEAAQECPEGYGKPTTP